MSGIFYDVMKKLSVRGNDVLTVLMLNTVFGAVLMSPILVGGIATGECSISSPAAAHGMIIIKSFIVLGSWILGYFAVKHLPLTIQGPINASRPVMVLVGAVAVYGEQLNLLQCTVSISLGFLSLYMISRISASEESRYEAADGYGWLSEPHCLAPSARFTTSISSGISDRSTSRHGIRFINASSCRAP